MTRPSFVATHCAYPAPSAAPIPLCLDADLAGDGPAYSESQWNHLASSAYAVLDGEWTLCGQPCPHPVLAVGPSAPATLARLSGPSLPSGSPWREDSSYPDRVSLRSDGSVVARWVALSGYPRVYASLGQFCAAWRVSVTFTLPRPAPDALLPLAEIHVAADRTAAAVFVPNSGDPGAPRNAWRTSFASLDALRRALDWPFDRLYTLAAVAREDRMGLRIGAPEISGLVAMCPPLTRRAWPGEFSLSPQALGLSRGAIDLSKRDALWGSMQSHGWVGRPLLVERLWYGAYLAWTGRHRILAARLANLESVPCVALHLPSWTARHGAPAKRSGFAEGALADTRSDAHRLRMLLATDDMTAQQLMALEFLGDS